jgi:hypothetical protein
VTHAKRYLELALRLGKHEPELVETYVGPPEPAAAVEAEEPLGPARLADEHDRCWTTSNAATWSRSGVHGSRSTSGRC